MNPHISKEIKEKYPTYDFIGIPFVRSNGRTYARAYHRILHETLIYCFEQDFFWFGGIDGIGEIKV